jgi:iron(III) transport system substrate-binding protein
MRRRAFLQRMATLTAIGVFPGGIARVLAEDDAAVSADELPALEGDLTLYLGRGEGGLYEDVLNALKKRNPELNLSIRRGPTAALANTLVAEAKAGVKRADLFWAVDCGALGLVGDAGLGQPLPGDLQNHLKPGFRYQKWSPVTGRIRTLAYNTKRVKPDQIPDDIMALPDIDLKIGWAPAYASFQSFITAMRLLEGEQATADWLRKVKQEARSYAGELGVVLATDRGEVDVGLANHYYTLRLKTGKPEAKVALAFTHNDAGSLLNAAGVMALSEGETPINFIRYLLSREVQSYLAEEAYEIPMVSGVAMPKGLPPLQAIQPPKIDLARLADLRPTLDLMREVGVL